MSKWFDADNQLFRILARVTDLMILNILFLLTSIPLITIGAACCALEETIEQLIKNEDPYLVKSYFKSFKKHFFKASKTWAIVIVISLIFLLDFQILDKIQFLGKSIFVGAFYGLGLIFLIILPFLFCAVSKGGNILYIVGGRPSKMIGIIFLNYLPIWLALLLPQTISAMVCIMFLFGFALIAYLKMYILFK